ncbi:hypothetical protein [Lactobacillus helveticus]|uniref:hypothetical protein n=1 Tax=Lactobacillus helveticus TaxID=1587 RepID=UPI00188514C9|nr:hypothetical protein [Lactobacillus helveticus]
MKKEELSPEQREEVRKIVREEIKKANMQSMSASKVAEITKNQIQHELDKLSNEFGTNL